MAKGGKMESKRSSVLYRVLFPGDWGTPRDKRNWLIVMAFTVLFALSWALVTYLIAAGYLAVGAPALAATGLPTLAGLGLVFAYCRFLRNTDELQRKIQAEGLAIGFGAGVFCAVLASMLQRAGIVVPETLSIPAIMICAYSIGVGFATARFGARL